MAALGALLLFVGFVVVMPRGASPGSAAARNVDMGAQGIHRTPGYQDDEGGRRATIRRVLVGLAIMAVGVLCLSLATS